MEHDCVKFICGLNIAVHQTVDVVMLRKLMSDWELTKSWRGGAFRAAAACGVRAALLS